MISSITRLRIFGVSLLLAVTMLPATVFAQTRPSIAALQAANTALQTRVSVLEANNVPGLASYLAVDPSTPTRPVVRVTAANFQVVNGIGSTFGTVNGLSATCSSVTTRVIWGRASGVFSRAIRRPDQLHWRRRDLGVVAQDGLPQHRGRPL